MKLFINYFSELFRPQFLVIFRELVTFSMYATFRLTAKSEAYRCSEYAIQTPNM